LPRFDQSFQLLFISCVNIFWRLIGVSTTSNTSSMKGENSDNNGSDFDRGNILKPTFDTLTKKGRKAFKAYLTDLKELLLLR
jgi:hypothetical protein